MKIFYHTSIDKLPNGTILQPYYGQKVIHPNYYKSNPHSHDQYLREMIIENQRVINFINEPSRLKSVYLFDDLNLATQYAIKYARKYIYSVTVDGNSKLLKVDMTFIDNTVMNSYDDTLNLANQYYSGLSSSNPNYEILCEGIVTIDNLLKII